MLGYFKNIGSMFTEKDDRFDPYKKFEISMLMQEHLKDCGPLSIRKEDGFEEYRNIELRRR